MAHNITSFAFRGDNAWHGLGARLQDNADLEDWIKAAGYDFEIVSVPVQYTPIGSEWPVPYDGKAVHYHSKTREPLAVVTDQFKIVQPRDVMAFFRQAIEQCGCKMETAAILRGGRKYFALAETSRSAVIAGSEHKQYLLLATACDGTLSTHCELTNVRVVCENTLREAIHQKNQNRVKVKHSTVLDPTSTLTKLGLLDFDDSFQANVEQLEQLAATRITMPEVRKIYAELLSPDRAAEFLTDEAQGKKVRAIRGLDDMCQSYLNGVGACPGTLYGALQGVTFYIDHVRGSGNLDTATWSALFDQGARVKDMVYARLVQMAN